MNVLKKIRFGLTIFLLVMIVSSCAYNTDGRPTKLREPVVMQAQGKQSLFVFYDGTMNSKKSNTNVYKLFNYVVNDNKQDTYAIWVEGVGATSRYITGNLFGGGIESRINTGYRFLSKHYNPGDDIYIIGFSRGSHQARALAGLVSYTGLLKNIPNSHKKFNSKVHTIIEYAKKIEDQTYIDNGYWPNWKPEMDSPLSDELDRRWGFITQQAPVKFLGLWDNVPGSSFKNFNSGVIDIDFTDPNHPRTGCKEDPNSKTGDRYKLDSYPSIKKIVHAVSIEEKRSKFHSVLVCRPINQRYTSVEQVWFPGAHSDVGGGYKDNDDLSVFALHWMIEKLTSDDPSIDYAGYQFANPLSLQNPEPNPLAPAHYSLGDFPANLGSACEDRPLPVSPNYYAPTHNIRLREDSVKVRFTSFLGLGAPHYRRLSYPQICQ